MFRNARPVVAHILIALVMYCLPASLSVHAQEVANFGGIYVGMDSEFDLAGGDSPPTVSEIRVEISQFGNLLSIRYVRTFEGQDLSAFDGEAVATGNSFLGNDIRHANSNNIFMETIEATLGAGGSLIGSAERPGGCLIEFTANCVSGGCGDEGEGEGEGEAQDRVFWRAADGDFGEATNWEPERVPTGNDTAVFDQATSYSVTVADASTRRAEVVRGEVEWVGGGLDLLESRQTAGLRSLEVGTSSEDDAFLILSDHTLDTVHAAIGRDANADGFLVVDSGALWQSVGLVSVGLNGRGTLDVVGGGGASASEARVGDAAGSDGLVRVAEPPMPAMKQDTGGTWSTGATAIGFSGRGELRIDAGGSVVSQFVAIGTNAGSEGVVSLGEGVTEPERKGVLFATWETEDLTVGAAGIGEIDIFANGELTSGQTAILGASPTGEGRVFLFDPTSRWFPTGDVIAGDLGRGVIRVQESSELIVPGVLSLGRNEGGVGIVLVLEQIEPVNQGSSLTIEGQLIVGSRGQGTLNVLGSGLLSEVGAFVGFDLGGSGSVRIEKAPAVWSSPFIELGLTDAPEGAGGAPEILATGTLTLACGGGVIADEVFVRAGSRIEGNGFIAGAAVEVEGTIAPGVAGAEETKQETSRTLTIGDSLTMNGGRIEATIDGTTEGEFDQLVVTGEATLNDTTLAISFADNFTPETGNEFTVIMTEGALTTTDLTMEIGGTNPDFEFMLVEANGMLMLMTTSGAEPAGEGDSEGTSEGNGETGCSAQGDRPSTTGTNGLGWVLLLVVSVFGLCRRPTSQ